jgi:hypothetical protein
MSHNSVPKELLDQPEEPESRQLMQEEDGEMSGASPHRLGFTVCMRATTNAA